MNRNLWLMVAAQALFMTNNIVFVAVNGLVGLSIAPYPWLATLPIMGYVLGGALSTGPVAWTQARWGRRVSFQIGLVVACFSSLLAGWAVYASNFWLLVGATVEDVGFDESHTEEAVRGLQAAAVALVPSLANAAVTSVRTGLRPRGPDGLPILGRSAVVPGLIYATAHYRNGVLLTPLTVRLVDDLVFDKGSDPALRDLDPARYGRL